MPIGAHYDDFGIEESKIWKTKVNQISDILLKNNFLFVAHSVKEKEFAVSLGWKINENIVFYKSGRPEELVGLYSQAECFIGNRVHGAICSAAAGAEVLSIGFDSRQEAVKLLNAKAIKPSEINLSEIEEFSNKKYKSNYNIAKEWVEQIEIFKEFMG